MAMSPKDLPAPETPPKTDRPAPKESPPVNNPISNTRSISYQDVSIPPGPRARPTHKKRPTFFAARSHNRQPRRPSLGQSGQTWSPRVGGGGGGWGQNDRPTMKNASALSRLDISHDEFNTHAYVSPTDGRIHISINKLKDGPLSNLLSSLNGNELASIVRKEKLGLDKEEIFPAPPKLNIVIMVIGSRGDIQPFVALAKVLVEQWGHRVRLATHGAFREFVEGNGVGFFEVGGDPAELMAFMVKNPGLVPSMETIKAGEIARRREQMSEMFEGFWRACVEPNDGHKKKKSTQKTRRRSRRSSSDDELQSPSSPLLPGAGSQNDHNGVDEQEGEESEEEEDYPFIADTIIANPPSFAHVHCAEKLGIPLHLMFTFPYSPTQAIPHPLANIQKSNVGNEYTNAISYPMVEMMTWQGLGDLVNRFRQRTLGLEPVATLWAPGMLSRLKVPYTYMWSPGLIPKPYDWGDHIDITGFVFLDLATSFEPPETLAEFLDAGPPPIYIGFGSIVVDNPDALTEMIFSAVEATGVRALVSKGWGGIGGENDAPEGIYMLENTPHDWLFSKVSAVIHHGGAGTTAIGLYHGKPTMIVPFFGDQPFWGAMVANAGAGAEPVPHKELTVEKLAAGIQKLLSEECRNGAAEISRKIKEEDGNGAENAVRSFFKSLNSLNRGRRGLGDSGKEGGEGGPMGPAEGKWGEGGPGIRCAMLEENVAVWRVRRTRVRLSALAAWYLVNIGRLKWEDLRLVRHTEWNDFDGPGEPVSGGFSALFASIANIAKGVFAVPYTWYKGARRLDEEGLELGEAMKRRSSSRSRSRSRSRSKSKSKSRSWKRSFSKKGQPPSQHEKEEDSWSDSSTSFSSSEEEDSEQEGVEKHQDSLARELAKGTTRGLSKVARTGIRAPLDVSLAVAQGFHNAPRLYGDEVRRPSRITGIQSGLRAAGKGFALGIYDGVTGIVVKPYKGAKENGPKGFFKGLGRGLAGGFFKTNAATAGVIAFTLKGAHKEIRKKRDRIGVDVVRRQRIKQGQMEYEEFLEESCGGGEEVLEKRVGEEGWRIVEMERLRRRERERVLEERISGIKSGAGRRLSRKKKTTSAEREGEGGAGLKRKLGEERKFNCFRGETAPEEVVV